jgi:signal transduction histidine kinase
MLKALPADLGFLAEVLRRYPVRVLFRGEVLPEGPLRGEKLWEEGEIALYWEGPPPSQEVREALRLLLKVFREVLELRERELALLKSQEETSRLLGLLLHEIKNPLMSVLGALELTLEVEGLPEEAKELLSIAEKSARRIQDLLNKAREYLRLGQGVRLKSERVDL